MGTKKELIHDSLPFPHGSILQVADVSLEWIFDDVSLSLGSHPPVAAQWPVSGIAPQ
jgi:hypothetical protein